jgi:hypothetical protein
MPSYQPGNYTERNRPWCARVQLELCVYYLGYYRTYAMACEAEQQFKRELKELDAETTSMGSTTLRRAE